MDKTNLLALELVNIPDDFVNLLKEVISKDRGTELIEIDQHLFLFPINSKIKDIIEEASFDYPHDVGAYQLRLVELNEDKTSFKIASNFISSHSSVIVEDDGLVIIDALFNLIDSIVKQRKENSDDKDNVSESLPEDNEDAENFSDDDEAFAQNDEQIQNEFEEITSAQNQTSNSDPEGEPSDFQDSIKLDEIFNDTNSGQDDHDSSNEDNSSTDTSGLSGDQNISEETNSYDLSDLDDEQEDSSEQSPLNEDQNNGFNDLEKSEPYESVDVLKDYDNDNARIYEVARHILDSETEPINLEGLNIPSNLESEAINITNEDYQQRVNLLNQICNFISNNYHANWKNLEN